jgi:hypothetical protein
MDAYLLAREGIALEGDGIFLGYQRMADQILSYDFTQMVRYIVDGMRLLMKGDDQGAEEALTVAARWFEASRDREKAPPVASSCVPVQTQNRFMPLNGQPISGVCWFGPVKIQSPFARPQPAVLR